MAWDATQDYGFGPGTGIEEVDNADGSSSYIPHNLGQGAQGYSFSAAQKKAMEEQNLKNLDSDFMSTWGPALVAAGAGALAFSGAGVAGGASAGGGGAGGYSLGGGFGADFALGGGNFNALSNIGAVAGGGAGVAGGAGTLEWLQQMGYDPSAMGFDPSLAGVMPDALSAGAGGFGEGGGFGAGDAAWESQIFGGNNFSDVAMNAPHGASDPIGMPQAGSNGPMNYIDELRKRLGLTMGGPWSTGLRFASSLLGMKQSNDMRSMAAKAAAQQDPFAGQRAQYGQKLNDLYANPSNVQALPGYQAGLDAVTRKMASQGYLGSGNMMTALHDYGGNAFNAEATRLAQLAGAGFSPSGGNALIAGNTSANNLLGQSLATLGYGVRSLEDLAGRN